MRSPKSTQEADDDRRLCGSLSGDMSDLLMQTIHPVQPLANAKANITYTTTASGAESPIRAYPKL